MENLKQLLMEINSMIMKMKVSYLKWLCLEKPPFLFIDVNLGKDLGIQRLVLYENDSPRNVAHKFGVKHRLPV